MTDVHAEQPGEAVKVLVTLGVVEVAALTSLDDGEEVVLPSGIRGEVWDEVLLGEFPLGAHEFSRGVRVVHCADPAPVTGITGVRACNLIAKSSNGKG